MIFGFSLGTVALALVVVIVIVLVVIRMTKDKMTPAPILPPLPQPTLSYNSPYATNGKDGCIIKAADNRCQTTACQADVARECAKRGIDKLAECQQELGVQCDPNYGKRTFDCNQGRDELALCLVANMMNAVK